MRFPLFAGECGGNVRIDGGLLIGEGREMGGIGVG